MAHNVAGGVRVGYSLDASEMLLQAPLERSDDACRRIPAGLLERTSASTVRISLHRHVDGWTLGRSNFYKQREHGR